MCVLDNGSVQLHRFRRKLTTTYAQLAQFLRVPYFLVLYSRGAGPLRLTTNCLRVCIAAIGGSEFGLLLQPGDSRCPWSEHAEPFR